MLNDFFSLMRSELILTGIIFILLTMRIAGRGEGEKLLPWIQLLLLINFIAGFFMCGSGDLFGNMFITNELIAFQKNILNGGVYLISLLFGGWLRQTRHLCEFFILMISALLGMFFMLSAGNLLMFYLSLELATIPVAALVNFDLLKRRSSEAAMKMIFSSAFSSGIMLFGISILYGLTGTLSFDELGRLMQQETLYNLAFIFFLATFAFKLSVVPFHFWTADVYEGAPVPVTSFLSVISKGAVAFVFMNMLYKVFLPMQDTWYHVIIILAMATMLIGNLFALRQQNLKRFLAFSSVAQVGFILAGISGGPANGVSSVIFFVIIYMVSNLAAFAVVDSVAAQTGKERVDDFKGFYKTNPFLSWIMAIALFSLAGIPPTAGFFGKFFLLSSAAGSGNYWLVSFAAINMVISLYYYLRVVRAVFIDQSEDPLPAIALPAFVKAAMIICAGAAILLGFMSWIFDHIIRLTV